MLHRSHRISARQFDEVMKKGRVTHSPLFIVRVVRKEGAEDVRIGAVAPVKVAKTAVLRNRTRRRVYEAIHPLMRTVQPGIHACVFAKAPAIHADLNELKVGIRELFVKAGLLR